MWQAAVSGWKMSPYNTLENTDLAALLLVVTGSSSLLSGGGGARVQELKGFAEVCV